jgi:hypothetical protein
MGTSDKPPASAIATVLRTAPDLVEVRFHEGALWSNAAIMPILEQRAALGREVPNKVLVVLPELLDFELGTMTTDHYAGVGLEVHCLAEAWVVRNAFNEKLARLYFSYFPSPVPCRIFFEEAEARTWLEEQ